MQYVNIVRMLTFFKLFCELQVIYPIIKSGSALSNEADYGSIGDNRGTGYVKKRNDKRIR